LRRDAGSKVKKRNLGMSLETVGERSRLARTRRGGTASGVPPYGLEVNSQPNWRTCGQWKDCKKKKALKLGREEK